MNADRLVQLYPWLDHLMAETLLTMSGEGKLRSYLEHAPERATPPTPRLLVGAINVEHPTEK